MSKNKIKKKSQNEQNARLGMLTSQVNDLILEKKWGEGEYKKELIMDVKNESSLFNRIISSLQKLNEEEQELLLKILGNVSLYSTEDYIKLCLKSFDILNEVLKETGNLNASLFVTPILEITEKVRQKICSDSLKIEEKDDLTEQDYENFLKDNRFFRLNSSSFLIYILKSNLIKYSHLSTNINLVIDENISMKHFHNKIIQKPNSKLIIIDDYSGTGKSFTDNIDLYLENTNIKVEDIYIISLVYTEIAKTNIIKVIPESNFIGIEKCNTIYSMFGDKEGSLNTETENKLRNINGKLNISNKKDHFLGIDKSGSLAIMLRTPNNTISTFWNSTLKEEERYSEKKVIFPRF